MARPSWSGAVSFGLVTIPVKAFGAVKEHTVHFHQLEKGTGARIRYQKVSEKSGDEVDSDDIEKGYAPRTLAYNLLNNQPSSPYFAMFREAVFGSGSAAAMKTAQSDYQRILDQVQA